MRREEKGELSRKMCLVNDDETSLETRIKKGSVGHKGPHTDTVLFLFNLKLACAVIFSIVTLCPHYLFAFYFLVRLKRVATTTLLFALHPVNYQ
jgi:hypothetical protein